MGVVAGVALLYNYIEDAKQKRKPPKVQSHRFQKLIDGQVQRVGQISQ
jgi:hypothetical protein